MTFQYNGKTYALVKQANQARESCDECAFNDKPAVCHAAPACHNRDADGDDLVFKEVPCSPT